MADLTNWHAHNAVRGHKRGHLARRGAVSPNGTLVALSSLDGFAPRQVHREVAGCAPANASRLKVISLTWSEAAPEDSSRRLLR
jgi:hypothetical protein